MKGKKRNLNYAQHRISPKTKVLVAPSSPSNCFIRGQFLIRQTCSNNVRARLQRASDPVFNSGVTCVLKHARLRLAHHTAPHRSAAS